MTDPALPQSLAERIRRFVYEHYIVAARAQEHTEVEVRAGDVHRNMGLVGRMPAVCSALGAKFETDYGVQLLERRGPHRGSNVFFRFCVDTRAAKRRPGMPERSNTMRKAPFAQDDQSDCRVPPAPRVLDGTVFLVSCVAAKRTSAAPAKDLYISSWFLKARRYVERNGAPWFILSAEYGLVPPDQVITPYERTLNTMPVEERCRWACRVIAQLSDQKVNATRIIFLAGARYREFLAEHFRRQGMIVKVPMEGLGIGQQLSWLGRS